SIIQFEHL
nr:Chain C, OVA mutant peptide [synthetic construct]7JI2_F Chain F, OVA mutant peptide [synthetic construct]